MAETAIFYFQTNALGFSPEFLGRMHYISKKPRCLGTGHADGGDGHVSLPDQCAGLQPRVPGARAAGGRAGEPGGHGHVKLGLDKFNTQNSKLSYCEAVWAQATPTAETAMFYFQTNALGFSPEFLGRVRLAGALASLVGVGVYNAALKELPLRRMFLWTAMLGAGLGMTQILLITGARSKP